MGGRAGRPSGALDGAPVVRGSYERLGGHLLLRVALLGATRDTRSRASHIRAVRPHTWLPGAAYAHSELRA